MTRRLATGRDLEVLVHVYWLKKVTDELDAGDVGRATERVAEHVAEAVEATDGAEALAALRAAVAALAEARGAAYALLRDEQISGVAFDRIAAAISASRRTLDALRARLRRRAWLRLTSGGEEAEVAR